MPTPRNDGHRFRVGTFTSASVGSAFAFLNFAVQADQSQDNQAIVPWAGPYQSLPPEYSRVWIAADGTQQKDGYYKGVIGPFSLWTFGMMSYFISTNFAGGVYSAAATIMVYDITDTAVFLNCTAYRPVVGQDMDAYYSGWQNVKIRYDFGVVTA